MQIVPAVIALVLSSAQLVKAAECVERGAAETCATINDHLQKEERKVFELPPLPWARNALVHISEESIDYHYGKHHQAYVTKLNAIVPGTPWEGKSLEEIIKGADGVIYNQAAQIWNHSFYWHSIKPKGGGEPTGAIKAKIEKSFGSFAKFKEEFSAAAAGHFGSGWAFLVQEDDGKLKIVQTHDAGNPLRDGTGKPIMTCDVWEHAYYIDFRNDRGAYIKAFWELVNWDFCNKNIE